MKDVRDSTTVAGARFLLVAALAPPPHMSHILRRKQNAFGSDGFGCKDIFDASIANL